MSMNWHFKVKLQASHIHFVLLDYSGSYTSLSGFTATQKLLHSGYMPLFLYSQLLRGWISASHGPFYRHFSPLKQNYSSGIKNTSIHSPPNHQFSSTSAKKNLQNKDRTMNSVHKFTLWPSKSQILVNDLWLRGVDFQITNVRRGYK